MFYDKKHAQVTQILLLRTLLQRSLLSLSPRPDVLIDVLT